MYCVLNMGWTPSKYINLLPKERAFVIASVLTKIEEEKKHQKELQAKQAAAKSRARRR